MKKVLITGGAGFVGRHFVKPLLDLGYEVHCVDNIIKGYGGIDPKDGWPLFEPRDYSNFKFYKEDCRKYFKRVNDDDFDYSFHLAAKVGGRLTIENDPLTVADNLSIDSEFWNWAKLTKPKKTICFSSSAVYPIKYQRKEGYKLKEDMVSFHNEIMEPDSSYGWAKWMCEYLARLAYKKYGIKSVCYRPFSGYGEDQSNAYPFPNICKAALDHKIDRVISMPGGGEQIRDFIYIDDCVQGVLSTMAKIDNAEAVNLSTDVPTKLSDVARVAAQICDYTPRILSNNDVPIGVFARVGDNSKLKSLGYEFKVSLELGIRKVLNYFSKFSKKN